MAISIGSGDLNMTGYLTTQLENSRSATNSAQTLGKMEGLSKDSSVEELTEAVKSFESYFVEQVIKEVKETFTNFGEDDEDAALSQQTDYFMDSTIQEMASLIVDRYGDTLTESLVEQMKLNYGISDV